MCDATSLAHVSRTIFCHSTAMASPCRLTMGPDTTAYSDCAMAKKKCSARELKKHVESETKRHFQLKGGEGGAEHDQ